MTGREATEGFLDEEGQRRGAGHSRTVLLQLCAGRPSYSCYHRTSLTLWSSLEGEEGELLVR